MPCLATLAVINLRAKYALQVAVATTMKQVQQLLAGCEEQNTNGQFTRPFRSGRLSSLSNKHLVTKGLATRDYVY